MNQTLPNESYIQLVAMPHRGIISGDLKHGVLVHVPSGFSRDKKNCKEFLK